MTLENITNELTEGLSRLFHCSAGWPLMVIFIVSLALLILAARAQARSRD